MASAKCPSCPSQSFDSQVTEVGGMKYKVILIKCAWCGVVVGNEPYYNTAKLLEKIGKALHINVYD